MYTMYRCSQMVLDPEWFGPRLRELREGAGLTQQQLADRVGVNIEAVSNWERGAKQPSWPSVVSCCVALGVDPGAFLVAPSRGARKKRKAGRPPKPKEDGGCE